MKKINYIDENKIGKQIIDLDDDDTIFDGKNIIYKRFVNNQEFLHIFNIHSKNHKFFASKNINDMLILEISDDYKIITCSVTGEVNQYTLKEKFVEYINLFKDKKMSFQKILKINKNKILLFKDDLTFYLFTINTKQIETKIKLESEVYHFLSIILDENRFNFNFYDEDLDHYEVQQKQITIFQNLGIKIKTNKLKDRIAIKHFEHIEGWDDLKYIIIIIYHFDKKGIDIKKKKLNLDMEVFI